MNDERLIGEFAGGDYEALVLLLDEQEKNEKRADEIKNEIARISMSLCVEANMTENSQRKTLKFMVAGCNRIVAVHRVDHVEITDPAIILEIESIKAKHNAKVNRIRAELAVEKRMIEVKAINSGKSRKIPSFRASFEKDRP